jgi:hypothetical protein
LFELLRTQKKRRDTCETGDGTPSILTEYADENPRKTQPGTVRAEYKLLIKRG